LAWCKDNRTAGFRVVGEGNSLHIEMRIPGADCNPYLAFSAALASGLNGIREKIEPPPCFEGNVYEAQHLPSVPKTLTDANKIFKESSFARKAFGNDVVDHYSLFFDYEVKAFNKAVTNLELARYFEQI